MITNIYGTLAYDSIISGYFCVLFTNFLFKGKILTDFTHLFSPNIFKDKHKNFEVFFKVKSKLVN